MYSDFYNKIFAATSNQQNNGKYSSSHPNLNKVGLLQQLVVGFTSEPAAETTASTERCGSRCYTSEETGSHFPYTKESPLASSDKEEG